MDVQRLVKERKQGVVGRRQFLATLAAGAAVAATPKAAQG